MPCPPPRGFGLAAPLAVQAADAETPESSKRSRALKLFQDETPSTYIMQRLGVSKSQLGRWKREFIAAGLLKQVDGLSAYWRTL